MVCAHSGGHGRPGPRSQRRLIGERQPSLPWVFCSHPELLCLPSHAGRASPIAILTKRPTGTAAEPSLRAAKLCVLTSDPPQTTSSTRQARASPRPTGAHPSCPCSSSRPRELPSRASPCRQPLLMVKARDRVRRHGRGCGGGVSMIPQAGALQCVLWEHSSNSLSSRCRGVESNTGHPLEAIWSPKGGSPEKAQV